MLRSALLFCTLLATATAYAQPRVNYEVSFPNAAHHEAYIVATFTGVPVGRPLEARMSRTSPGRYALHEFAKNVYDVHAFDSNGEELPIARPNPHQWNVSGHDGTVQLVYTLFADRADGTYSAIDNTHAHLNAPATFLWARGFGEAWHQVTFQLPDPAWKIATQLYPAEGTHTFAAPTLQYFMDSPIEISAFDERWWQVEHGGETGRIRLIVHHTGNEADVTRFADMARKVTDELVAVFGDVVENDNGHYTFLADYTPWVNGDGMEHRNSTVLTSTRPLEGDGALRNLGTLAHEYIHQWNVERLRPASLEPFDFEEANMSEALWFAEGFTSYYDDLAIRRAGLMTEDEYAAGLAGGLNSVLNSPGRQYFSPVEMSMQAPFVDAATSVDPQNKQNTFISYYTWGAMIGLGLDLTLRARYDLPLDTFMQAVWQHYGTTETPYTLADLEATLAEVTNDAAFAATFFDRYIEGREVVDYASLLANAGYVLQKRHPGAATLGGRLTDTDEGVTVAARTTVGSPLYAAGLDQGDVLLTLNGRPAPAADAIQNLVEAAAPGDTFAITFRQRGQTRSATLTLAEDPTLEVVPAAAPTDAQRRFRTHWLSSKAR